VRIIFGIVAGLLVMGLVVGSMEWPGTSCSAGRRSVLRC
jgi:hypothetical protein